MADKLVDSAAASPAGRQPLATSAMNLLLALFAGALSAFAFEPFGLIPLMPLAFAALCELIARAPTLKRALLIGWGFGVGQFCIGLNWIATAFTFQAAMPPSLGWVAVVLLSLYLAVYPMLAAGLAWRWGAAKARPADETAPMVGSDRSHWCWRSRAHGQSPNGCARRSSPALPGTRSAPRWSTRRGATSRP